MIADKQVVERLREYEAIFAPALSYISGELQSPKPSLDKIASLLDVNDAEIAFLDFADLLSSVQRTKRKLAQNRLATPNPTEREKMNG